MPASPPPLRFERKCLLAGLSLPEGLTLVRRHPALFREVYPPRFVNNLYFDTPGLRHFYDHVHGVSHRLKHRARWYGALKGSIARPAFEQKIKHGLVSRKVTAALPAFTFSGGGAREVHAALATDQATPPQVRAALRQLEPALVNRYFRHYFVSADGLIRLTLDADLRFFDANDRAGSDSGLSPCHFPLVLELKYDPVYAARAAAVSNALPYRLARCSKYVLGVECLRGTHPTLPTDHSPPEVNP
jgi:hypothetical protein